MVSCPFASQIIAFLRGRKLSPYRARMLAEIFGLTEEQVASLIPPPAAPRAPRVLLTHEERSAIARKCRRKYLAENPRNGAENTTKRAEYQRKWRAANPDKALELSRRQREKDVESYNERKRKSMLLWRQKRRAAKAANENAPQDAGQVK